MKKQTVEERYLEQQVMNQQLKPKQNILQETEPKQKQNLIKIFNEIKSALDLASQSVHQVKLTYLHDNQLSLAEQRLTHAIQQVQQLQTLAPEMTSGLSNGTKQQLTQLSKQINTASGTLQLIQQSIQSN